MTKKIIFTALIALVFVFPIVGLAAEQNIYVAANETIKGNFIKVGNVIEIDGNIGGDVVVAGNTININGSVAGDVIAAGNNIKITGPVFGSIRVIGNNINIDSRVEKNLWLAGSQINVSEKSQVGWDAYLACAQTELRGVVSGKTYLACANAFLVGNFQEINLALDRDGQATISPKASVEGKINYFAAKQGQLNIQEGSKINDSQINYQPLSIKNKSGESLAGVIFSKLIKFFSLLILGLVLISLWPKKVLVLRDQMIKGFWPNLGFGVALLVLIPIISLILALTLIGFSLASMLMMVLVIIWHLAQALVGLILGLWIFEKQLKKQSQNLIWPLSLGLLFFVVLISLPYIGWLVKLISVGWSLGALWIMSREMIKAEK